MRNCAATLCLAVFLVAGCGANGSGGTGGGSGGCSGGGNAASNSPANDSSAGNSDSGTDGHAGATDSGKRETQVAALVKAFRDLDEKAVLDLFHPDHKKLAEERITGGFKKIRDAKGEWLVETKPITEKDGKHIVEATMTIKEPGQNHSGMKRSLELVLHNGKWLFKFYP
ncbi:MAG: hypothetical protein IPK87_14205 [Planctomycetes bacterium]|nr:hypothetical protein [Planctomycetota bacterium]